MHQTLKKECIRPKMPLCLDDAKRIVGEYVAQDGGVLTEAQLRRKTEIPLIFIYNDGDPVDEARLSGFAWRLKNRPPRNPVP